MRKVKTNMCFIVIAIITFMLTMFPICANAASEAGQFDLDVMFVIDNSGSMLDSDPERLALVASNLFIDMCEDSDSRIGYVMYTEKIPSMQPLTDITNFSQELKKAIAAVRYQNGGCTDTALGLDKAFELLELDAFNGRSNRKPVVILLSDGNTNLDYSGTRTTEESLADLEVIKNKFAQMGVPIYTIGFNYDGTLDVDAMSQIAEATGAMVQEAKRADELPYILRCIYGDLTGANSISLPTITATGEPQSVVVPIDNDSIYKATITIMSKNEVRDIYLTSPNNSVIDESDTSGKLTTNKDPSSKYTLLTLYHPNKGSWKLTFTGTKDDTVSIDLLSVYDLKLVMDDPVASYSSTDISWHLEDSDGNSITDPSLISELTVTMHANNDSVVEEFPVGHTSASFALAPGNYEAFLTMNSGDIVRTSNTKSFSVPEGMPIALKDPAEDTVNIQLITLFQDNKTVYIDELVDYADYNRPLKVDFTGGEWEKILKADYDSVYEAVYIKAFSSGSSETEVNITGADGSKVTIFIVAKIFSGWLLIIAAAAILLIILAVIILILQKKKPYLDTPMRDFSIQVNLPFKEFSNQPPETRLRFEHKKSKRTLDQQIAYNHADDYNIAFQSIGWLATGLIFSAKNTSEIIATIPVNNRYTVVLDGKKLSAPANAQLTKRKGFTVKLLEGDDNEYEIIIGNSSSQADADFNDVFSIFDSDSSNNNDKDIFDF